MILLIYIRKSSHYLTCLTAEVAALRSSNCPIWQVAARLVVALLSQCARSSSIDSGAFVFAFRGSVSLLPISGPYATYPARSICPIRPQRIRVAW